MMRRIWVVTLAVALLSALLPAPIFAEETARTQADTRLVRIVERLNTNATRIVIAAPPQLQDAAQQGTSESFWRSKRGKVTLAVAIIAASVAGGIAIAQGPDPRPWP
jgi:hypothetical protein